jgi:dethiobiotin synthetase
VEQGLKVAAFKPVCSGGRGDAVALRSALGNSVSLEVINPWHFRAGIAPLLAARREKKRVLLAEVVAHIKHFGQGQEVVLVEGAGGLLSPLGEGFNSRDLLVRLRAKALVVALNRLGVVNHLLLTLEALPPLIRAEAQIVLMSLRKADAASRSNLDLLRGLLPGQAIGVLPWLAKRGLDSSHEPQKNVLITKVLRALTP